MTKKKKTVLAAASGVALIALVGVLLAYFGADDTEPNLVGVGEDEVSVVETFTQPSQEQDFAYRKLVKIQNTGSVPCYIRARLEFSNSAAADAAFFSSANQDSDSAPDDDTFKRAQIAEGDDYYIKNLPDGWVYVWEKNADSYTPTVTNGYYYYTKPVEPGDSTDALISWVKMHYGSTAEIHAHDVYVYAESVQTVDPNTGAAYANWKAAWNTFAG